MTICPHCIAAGAAATTAAAPFAWTYWQQIKQAAQRLNTNRATLAAIGLTLCLVPIAFA